MSHIIDEFQIVHFHHILQKQQGNKLFSFFCIFCFNNLFYIVNYVSFDVFSIISHFLLIQISYSLILHKLIVVLKGFVKSNFTLQKLFFLLLRIPVAHFININIKKINYISIKVFIYVYDENITNNFQIKLN